MVHGELSSVNREPVNHEQSSENREPVNREQRSFEQLVQRGLTIPNVHCRQSQSKALSKLYLSVRYWSIVTKSVVIQPLTGYLVRQWITPSGS